MSSVQSRYGGRIAELDVLRGLAAVAVMLFHYTVRYGDLYGYSSRPAFRIVFGHFGVQFFFCISGFVILMTLERARRPLDFVVSRFSRLWPAYIVAMIITYAAVHVFGLSGRATTFPQALVNLTMLQDLVHVPSVDEVYWSLQVELIFYFWMLVVYVAGMLKSIRMVAALWLIPSVVYFLAERVWGRELSYLAGTLLLVHYIPYFVIGIAAYNLRTQHGGEIKDIALMLCAIGVAATCLSLEEGVVALTAAAVFLLVAYGALRWIAAGPLVFLGSISYTLYLLHQNIGYIVIRAATRSGATTGVAVSIAVCVSVALAAGLTWGVERPAQKWLRGLYRQYCAAVAKDARPTRITAT